MTEKRVTNKQFANTPEFIALCEGLKLKPTKRMASKFRMGKGTAYLRRKEVKLETEKA